MDVFGSTLTSKQTRIIKDSNQLFNNKLNLLSTSIDNNLEITQRLEHKIKIIEQNLIEIQVTNETIENNLKKMQTIDDNLLITQRLEHKIRITEYNLAELLAKNSILENVLKDMQTKHTALEISLKELKLKTKIF